YVSPAYEAIWGRPVAELFVNPWSFLDALHPDDREAVRQTIESGPPGHFSFEARIVRLDGTERWVHCRGFPLANQAGVVDRCAGMSEDVTERKRAEQALRESVDHFRLLIEMAPSVIVVLDRAGRVVEWNHAAEQLHGYRRSEAVGLDYFETFLPAEVRAAVR